MTDISKSGAVLQLVAKGGPFQVVKTRVPSPDADEVVVKLNAVGLNPLDWKQMAFGMMIDKFPAVLGLEASGTVEAVGTDVSHVKPGDGVMARCTAGGRAAAYQEYAAVKRADIALKPEALTFEDASSLPVGFYTAVTILHEGLGLSLPFINSGRTQDSVANTFLVVGGSSAVGAAAIQILRLSLQDAVIVTTCSPPHFAKAVALGAKKAFDSKSATLIEDIRAESLDSKGFDAIIDTVNGIAAKPELLDLLTGSRQFAELLTGRNIAPDAVPKDIKHSLIHSGLMDAKPYAPSVLPSLTNLVASEKYVLPVRVEVVGQGIEKIEQGLKRLMEGVSGTKLVVKL